MIHSKLTFLTSLLSVLTSVSAHGYLRQMAIDGTFYRGNIPNGVTNFPSPIRSVKDIVPVKGANNTDLNCGIGAQAADEIAAAMPGSTLTFDWANGENGFWPHNTGPMLTYLASCGNTTCDKFDAMTAKFFKIDQAGQKNSTTWFQNDIMQGKTYSLNLPNDLAAGDYLVRHEIIGLHVATTLGGAEFYPACAQIRVGGNGTMMPNVSDLVSFPGAYTDTDPGILVPDVFNPGFNYTNLFPGPAIDSDLAATKDQITDPAPSTTGLPDPTFTTAPNVSSIAVVNAASITSSSTMRSKLKGMCKMPKSKSTDSATTTTAKSTDSATTTTAAASATATDSLSGESTSTSAGSAALTTNAPVNSLNQATSSSSAPTPSMVTYDYPVMPYRPRRLSPLMLAEVDRL